MLKQTMLNKSMMNWTRYAFVLSMLFIVLLFVEQITAEEQRVIATERWIPATPSASQILGHGFRIRWTEISNDAFSTPIELPGKSRVSRSRRSLRQITLVGGDHFVAEYLDWETNIATFRLLSGQTFRVPIGAISVLANPPGETDVVAESFEADSNSKPSLIDRFREPGRINKSSDAKSYLETSPNLNDLVDETQAVDGDRSLRIHATSSGYRHSFIPPLTAARIEFSFRTEAIDSFTACGEWQLQCEDNNARPSTVTVVVSADQRISVAGLPESTDATFQSLRLSEGWHSFVALISPARTRLIVDDAILASFVPSNASVRAIRFQPSSKESKNLLWIDELQVRSIAPVEVSDQLTDSSADSDLIRFTSGDDVFGRLIGLTRKDVSIEAFGEWQFFPWSRLAGVAWKQPSKPVRQTAGLKTGIVARIEMQPFVDRPECEPEHWTATVVSVNPEQLIAEHSVVGKLIVQWSEIRRIIPQFFGQSYLLDGRRFHLGDSIHSDFHRHLPDGTELREDFALREIPRGTPYLSLDVAELEAAGPMAPPGSPFLADLRAGRLVTDVYVNEQRIGNLNSLIRFKATSKNPDRIRLTIPRGVLKNGENSFRLQQKSLKESGHEFDDCEVGNFRLEFHITD